MSDPTRAIREHAGRYPDVDTGTSCSQTSFKTKGKAFLYVGEQGGRYKAMFKLKASRGQALALAKQRPKDVQVSTGAWVTVRFSAEAPLPKTLWKPWLDESYRLSNG